MYNPFKNRHLLFILFFCSLFSVITKSFAQEELSNQGGLNFFLDCYSCDFNFVRQELEFVSFVRDPNIADVHILTTSSRTGSGGRKYFMNFIGLKELDGINFEYEYSSEQNSTDDEIRKGLLKLIQTGVLQYYSATDFFDIIKIELSSAENKTAVEMIEDPWNLWVYRISLGSDFRKEASQDEFSLGTRLDIRKVTEDWKIYFEADYDINRENFYDEDEKIENNQNRTNIEFDYIKSLTDKWSAAVFADYASSTYMNIKNEYSFDLGAEYNIWPWDISNEKVFALRYRIGGSYFNYREETIYDKLNELLFYQSFGANLEMVQPWGRIEVWLEGRHFFHDFSKNRIILFSDFSNELPRCKQTGYQKSANC